MKKYICMFSTLCLFVGFSNKLEAQSTPKLGIIGGANFATISNASQGRRIGFMAGLYGDFLLGSRYFSFSPEVLYSQKGYETKVFDQGQQVEERLMLDYIDIPLLIKYDFIPDGPVNPDLYAGPYIGFNVNSKYEFSNNDEKTSETPRVKTTDLGFVIGGEINLGPVNVGARYGFGLLGFYSNSQLYGTRTKKKRVISLVAGFGF